MVWGKAAGCSCLVAETSKSSVMRPRTPGTLWRVEQDFALVPQADTPPNRPRGGETANSVPGAPGPLVIVICERRKALPAKLNSSAT